MTTDAHERAAPERLDEFLERRSEIKEWHKSAVTICRGVHQKLDHLSKEMACVAEEKIARTAGITRGKSSVETQKTATALDYPSLATFAASQLKKTPSISNTRART